MLRPQFDSLPAGSHLRLQKSAVTAKDPNKMRGSTRKAGRHFDGAARIKLKIS
jgi:hypothetical protein